MKNKKLSTLICALSFAVLVVVINMSIAFATSSESAAYNDNLLEKTFLSIYEEGNFICDNEEISLDSDNETGIIVSGKNKVLKDTRFTIDEEYDFGSYELQRIQFCALGVKGKSTKLSVYLDGEDEPVGTVTLPVQKTSGDWNYYKNINLDVSDLKITGKHSIQLGMCQYYNGEPKTSGTAEICLQSFQFVAKTIPTINVNIDESLGTIDAMNNDEDHQTECYGNITIDVPDGYDGSYDDNYAGGTYELEFFKGRGNSTWKNPGKKPYKIKLEKSENLFGMGKSKHWALVANAMDPSLSRNTFTYKLGEELKMAFTPQCVSVDVVVNGVYYGNYLLCETVRVEENRVNIDDLEDVDVDDEETITGGYLLGLAYYGSDDDAYKFTTKHQQEFNVNSPACEDNEKSAARNEYIENYIQRVENAIYNEPNPETGEVEDPFDLMDLESTVEYYWVQELCGNGDFLSTGSTYCYKLRNGKLYWGPLWDFDIAWNEINEDFPIPNWRNQKGWFKELLSNEEYYEAAVKYWNEVIKPATSELVADGSYYDEQINSILYSAINDSLQVQRYNYNDKLYDVDTIASAQQTRGTYLEKAAALKQAILKRIEMCDEAMDTFKPKKVHINFIADGKTVFTVDNNSDGALEAFPEEPESADPEKIFTGWYYTTEIDGELIENELTEMSWIVDGMYEVVDDEYVMNVTAKFVSIEPEDRCKKILFEQPEYTFVLENHSGSFAPTNINFATYPLESNMDSVKWIIEDPSIIDIYPGGKNLSIVPEKTGTTKVTAKMMDGSEYSVDITIVDIEYTGPESYPHVESFELSDSSIEMEYGDYYHFDIDVLSPDEYLNLGNTDGFEYVWYSNSDVVDVINGTIFTKSVGTAIIACRNVNANQLEFCSVKVLPTASSIKSVAAGKNAITVNMASEVTATGGEVYEVAYRIKDSEKWTTIMSADQTITIDKLASGQNYEVRVRAVKTLDEHSYRGDWSEVKTSDKTTGGSSFKDIDENAWYYDSVQKAVDLKLMNGTSADTFDPNGAATRAMIVQILYNHAGKPSIEGQTIPFTDVASDAWYHDAIVWAYNAKVTSGISDTLFAPEKEITREQIAALLYSYDKKPAVSGSLSDFEDSDDISSWAVNAVQWAVDKELIKGSSVDDKLYLNPGKAATRAEIAAIMTRFVEK